jgi:uncharacterized protein
MADKPWYQAGLKFTCTQCGNCCTGAPGYTWVNDSEIAAFAKKFGVDEGTFRTKYTRKVPGRGVTLKEKPNNDCVFFERGTGCTVYAERPRQCRTWPFWHDSVDTAEHWQAQARGCPGMNHGKLHDAAKITATAADDGLA